MFLLRVKPTLQHKLTWLLLCLLSSTCYGQSDEESIPLEEISSKEQIDDQSLLDYDFFIGEDTKTSTIETSQVSQAPSPETVSSNLISIMDPLPNLPLSIDEVIKESRIVASEDWSLALFAENLPKPYLRISTKEARAIPSFTPENKKIASRSRQAERPSQRMPRLKNQVDLLQVFAAAPWIYSALGALWIYAFALGFYNLNSIRKTLRCADSFIQGMIPKIEGNAFDDVLSQCEKNSHLLSKLIATSVSCRTWGLPAMLEHMKSEGRRYTQSMWHRIGILSDVAMISPLIGLLGTVIGMFYAFNDVSRSANSLLQFMDGLGVSIGTTVAGLLVAISALCFQTICRDRLARAVVRVEQNALDIARLVDRKSR